LNTDYKGKEKAEMKIKRIMSAVLALMMLVGTVTIFSDFITIDISAAWEDKVDAEGDPIINYMSQIYSSPEAKLADMTLMKEQNGYQIYVEEYTGEVAFVNTATGQTLFTNPYDIAGTYNSSTENTKAKLLSQIALKYTDNGVEKTMYSYTEAAKRGQITVKNIKNGIRMEYSIGELQTIRLVPRRIEKSRFETLILNNITNEFYRNMFVDESGNAGFYKLYDTSDPTMSETMVKETQAAFPVTKRMAIYVCDTDISSMELKRLETIIKTYCPLYTYEEMDYDHNETDYVGEDKAPANFKMALEYTIDEDGLEVRLPANGIRFDESTYSLSSVDILPYMGAGSNEYTGYCFIPDGSGALIRFEDLIGTSYTVSGQLYGADYAYHTITGQHSETWRYPVFGVVTDAGESKVDSAGNVITSNKTTASGYVAIITEGDSMATLIAESGGVPHCYNSVYARFNPRPSDTYNLADSINLGVNATWTVTSSRKYTGSYRIKYIMLTDDSVAEKNGIEDYYECSYVGMAKAYRDYLEETGAITLLEQSSISDDIPLYIESFGSFETTKKVLSFPVLTDVALTTFEDVQTMYEELSAAGITNVKMRLTGFANGGMKSTYPSTLKWVSAVGGESGFKELLSYAATNGLSVYPDFDFAYVEETDWFDGISVKRDAVKTIDSRYTSRRYYDAATQSFESDSALAVSPSVYEKMFAKFEKLFSKYENVDGVSVSTLGTTLNSDFDKDDPYNREDSKEFTTELLQSLKDSFGEIMVDGGNAYSIPYADHILGVSTESSNYLKANESVPFLGIVLHGYKSYAGEAMNMEGDISSAILRAIENGAYPYFILSYRNTSELKEDETLNQYYSVDYSVWKDDMIERYNVLNEALSDLQTKRIEDHQFLNSAVRYLTDEEALAAGKRQDKEDFNLGDQVSEGTVVNVEYEGGTGFILNYNSYDVSVTYRGQTYIVGALSFLRIDHAEN
jgi:hypothetical protein